MQKGNICLWVLILCGLVFVTGVYSAEKIGISGEISKMPKLSASPSLKNKKKANLDVVDVRVVKIKESPGSFDLRISGTVVNLGAPTETSLTKAGVLKNCKGTSKTQIKWTSAAAPGVHYSTCAKIIPALKNGQKQSINCLLTITCIKAPAILSKAGPVSPCRILPNNQKKIENMAISIIPDDANWIDESNEGGASIGWGVYPDWY